LTTLYIDTTYDISIGILSQATHWLEFQIYKGQRVSNILQKEVHNLLRTQNLKLKNISKVVTVAGPGFYTGLRLSEGFADILNISGISHFSFLSYQVPKLIGISEGVWITKAYRGEYLIHSWDPVNKTDLLISDTELNNHLSQLENAFIHSESAIDDKILKNLKEFQTTQSLIQKYPDKIFKEIISQEPSYYFRAPEDEFKVSQK
jgi:tRNA threonylcarbamoyladenosine biosynthesis protein TsaB